MLKSIFRSAARRQRIVSGRKLGWSRAGELKMYWTKPLQELCRMGFV
jgi:hypothetical protein